jgi:hypothetical protein
MDGKNYNCFRFRAERGSFWFYNDDYLFILFFYFSVYKISPRKTNRFLQSYPVSGRKFHLVGSLKRSFFDYIISFLMRKEKLQKNDENDGNFTISSNPDYSFLRHFETNRPKFMKFSPNMEQCTVFM